MQTMEQEVFEVCAAGNRDRLSEIINESGFDKILSLQNLDGKTAPEIAASCGNLGIIEELVTNGLELNSCSVRGYTLLHWTASWGQLDVTKYLVYKGVNLTALNKYSETPRQMAAKFGKQDCEVFLEKSELLEELKSLALTYKDIIADPEKHFGKFNKEDKVQGNRYCDEKLGWVENNRDFTNRQQVKDQINELKVQLQNSMNKLKDP